LARRRRRNASGKYFGLTRDFVVTILYYNKNLFDTARVPYRDASWSYDMLLQHAPKFAKSQDSPETSEWAFIASAGHNNFDAIAEALNGKLGAREATEEANKVLVESYPQA
jgi:ABC-type glycerol-3-phosphate transport system substrate-binding protein